MTSGPQHWADAMFLKKIQATHVRHDDIQQQDVRFQGEKIVTCGQRIAGHPGWRYTAASRTRAFLQQCAESQLTEADRRCLQKSAAVMELMNRRH